ncbi:hypothetical protein PGT21_015110 [Puccinia graminis f. sp. tritici]|uniref:Uncharacterized protein n=1 Tax=Puccinia graminis f. sp. tritici TaxID=56615 RepID=A0A5B0NC67_PUCGR|nr:hypothetical protein PGT21_015110 [Puccinia graminis f. sp. tritici]
MKSLAESMLELERTLHNLNEFMGTLSSFYEKYSNVSLWSTDYIGDHHLQDLKFFKYSLIHPEVRDLVQSELGGLFADCRTLIGLYKQSDYHHEYLFRQAVLASTAACNRSIDHIIKLARQSDFAILRDIWQAETDLMDDSLQALTSVTHRMPHSEPERPPPSVDDAGDRILIDLNQERILRLARSAIPLVKLTRLFLNKLSKMTKDGSAFKLNPELDSRTLDFLSKCPGLIATHVYEVAMSISALHKNNQRIDGSLMSASSLDTLSNELKFILLLLPSRLIPITPHSDHSTSPSHFSLWSCDLKALWSKAVSSFLEASSQAELGELFRNWE